MSISAHFQKTEGAGFIRCDNPAVARRQLEVSIGLVAVLLLATLAALVTMPMMNGPRADTVAAATPSQKFLKDSVVRTHVRVIPIFNVKTAAEAAANRS